MVAQRPRRIRQNYARSEKRKLLAVVDRLCQRHGRSVSSADLLAHFNEHPNDRPCLTKRLGQQLIAAADPKDRFVPRLARIGVFGAKVFYSAEDTSEWRARFADYCAERRAEQLIGCGLPGVCSVLEETAYWPFALHAVHGWVAEAEHLKRSHRDPQRIVHMLSDHHHLLGDYIQAPFQPGTTELIGRTEATAMLLEKIAPRHPEGEGFSTSRVLAELRWPQSPLFAPLASYRLSPTQLDHYIRGFWPLDDEDAWTHQALFVCWRFGPPPM